MKFDKKTLTVGAIILGVTAFAGIMFSRSCRLTDRYSVLVGEYSAYKKQAKQDLATTGKIIEGSKVEIARLSALNATLVKGVAAKENTIGGLKNEVGALERSLASAKSDAERVIILSNEVKKLTEAFSLAESTIVDLHTIVFNLNTKYKLQVDISVAWELRYNNEHDLRLSGERVSAALRKSLRTTRLWGTVKSGLIVAAAGVVVYGLVKK